MHNTLTIEKNNQHWLDMAPTLTCFLNRLYHSFICVMPILSSTKAFCIISIVSVQLLPRLEQNLIQIRWFVLSVIFNCKQMRRTGKARWTEIHAARDPRRPAGNYGIQGVREKLLVTFIPRRGRSSALARGYKCRSDTVRTHSHMYLYLSNMILTSMRIHNPQVLKKSSVKALKIT